MQILPIIFQPKTYIPQSRVNFRGELNKDVVTLSKKEFLTLPPKEIWARINSSLENDKNFLGSGGEADVWKIEGTNYCIRIPNGTPKGLSAKPNFNLTKQDKVNHVIAKFSNRSSIMPVIEGYTMLNSRNARSEDVAKMLENMPQKAFDDLFLQVYHAYKAGMYFDTGTNNIIINPKNQTLTAIDFVKNTLYPVENNILNSLFFCLTTPSVVNKSMRKSLAGKFLSAPLNAVKAEPKRDIDLTKCGFSDFIDSTVENENYAKLLKRHLNKIVVKNNQGKSFLSSERIVRCLIKQLFFS